jgi:predicted RNA-binding protein with EMAP domain
MKRYALLLAIFGLVFLSIFSNVIEEKSKSSDVVEGEIKSVKNYSNLFVAKVNQMREIEVVAFGTELKKGQKIKAKGIFKDRKGVPNLIVDEISVQ